MALPYLPPLLVLLISPVGQTTSNFLSLFVDRHLSKNHSSGVHRRFCEGSGRNDTCGAIPHDKGMGVGSPRKFLKFACSEVVSGPAKCWNIATNKY